MTPLVCIFAHPDDEAFGPAGAIATFAKQRDVYILCATRGDKEGIGHIREKELVKSAEILGVKEVRFLDFKDGSLNNNAYHHLADAIKKELEHIKPDTVMTYNLTGISGHLDHIAVSLATTYVFRQTPWLKTLLYFGELEEKMKTFRNQYFIYMPPGFKKEDFDLVVDTTDVWEKRIAAIHAHVSQKADADMILSTINNFPKQDHFRVLKQQ